MNTWRRTSWVALVLVALSWHGCSEAGEPGSDCGPATATVTRVIDGDTVELESGELIRYLLVDSPESTSQIDCFGPEAAEFNTSVVENQSIELTYDQECTDRFGRLLAYVTVAGRDINTLLVERGYACVLQIPPNGESRVDALLDVEALARARKVGMWGACDEIACD